MAWRTRSCLALGSQVSDKCLPPLPPTSPCPNSQFFAKSLDTFGTGVIVTFEKAILCITYVVWYILYVISSQGDK